MKRLKNKYKYADRQSHFLALEREKRLKELYGNSVSFGFLSLREKHTGGILRFIENMHWDKETEMKLIKIPNFSSAHTSVISALEKVDGTTNPSVKESSHISDGISN